MRRRLPGLLACCSALVLLTGLAACSDGSDASSTPVYHEGDSIRVANGDEFVIALEANPSTGYTWDAGDNPNVQLVSSKQVNASSGLAGAPGTQEMTFEATKPGTSTLELAYARQFEGGVPPAQTATFDVTVT
jgi:inhibitor of cysteine peptidase